MELKDYRHIHFIGIGGIGVSAIAEIVKSRGVEASGSDMKASEVTESLEKQGIRVHIGHDAENIKGADLVVYSTAVSLENPEILAAKAAGIPVITRSEALGLMMTEYPVSVAVAGTHGKTTTTSMVYLILEHAGMDPTVLVGGILNEFHSNARIGKSDRLVAEACEYMDSFLDLKPLVEIILNIDSDHLDYFKDIDHIAKSFGVFTENLRDGGFIVAYDSNPFVKSVTENCNKRVVYFGFNETSDFYAKNISFNEEGHPSYDLYSRENGFERRIELGVPGEHNVANSLAAIATCVNLGVGLDSIEETLESFRGTQRRFDIIGKTKEGCMVVDDYAHHPTEIKATLAAAQHFTHRTVWCLFQPHTYTRTLALMDEFADSFKDADKVVFAEIYAAREKNIYKVSSKALLDRVKERHPEKDAFYFDSFEKIADFVANNASEGDMIITMGAGDIYKVGEMILGNE